MAPALARDQPHTRRSTAEGNQPELHSLPSTPDIHSVKFYPHPTSQAYRFSGGVDALSWGSSSLPYLQYDTALPSELTHSMSLNFNSHNNLGSSAPLDILNAESYNFGEQVVPNLKGQRKRPQVEKETRSLPFGVTARSQINSVNSKTSSEEHEGRQKKKARVEILSEEEDGSKKVRGRPRLDTKDTTAKDRRRTQIRNAQRAYRSRKETTISSLESQVQELRGTNEEMNNMFMSLYDFANGKGLLQREPEFGQHLITLTERYKMLAKSPAGDESPKDEEEPLDNRGKWNPPKSEPSRSQTESTTIPAASTAPDPTSAWGYQISYDTQATADDIRQAQNSVGLQQIGVSRNEADSQTIAEVTPENASFLEMMNSQHMQQYRVEIPSIDTYAQYFPEEVLPLPHSFAYTEKSFARRLHRAACERGYKLITAQNPPPERLKKVFSMSLKFSSKEHIKARLANIIFGSAKDSLQAWREPFVHIGGAGTYYPVNESDIEGMPKFRTGLSMGPFSEEVVAAQQNFMEDNMRARLPGFEGEWFDPNDVVNYLRRRGVNIRDDMQFAQVDLETFYGISAPRSVSSITQPFSPRTPMSSPTSQTMQGNYSATVAEDIGTYKTNELIDFDFLKPNDGSNLPLMLKDWGSEGYGIDSLTGTETEGSFGITGFNTIPDQRSIDSVSPVSSNRSLHRIVTINVNDLLNSLLANTVCLARTPGFRPANVEAAIHTTIGEAVLT